MIEVVEIQLLVVHCVAPIDIDGDVSIGAKFVPESVSVEPPVAGPLTMVAEEANGSAEALMSPDR
jgi:hypothetical protein